MAPTDHRGGPLHPGRHRDLPVKAFTEEEGTQYDRATEGCILGKEEGPYTGNLPDAQDLGISNTCSTEGNGTTKTK